VLSKNTDFSIYAEISETLTHCLQNQLCRSLVSPKASWHKLASLTSLALD